MRRAAEAVLVVDRDPALPERRRFGGYAAAASRSLCRPLIKSASRSRQRAAGSSSSVRDGRSPRGALARRRLATPTAARGPPLPACLRARRRSPETARRGPLRRRRAPPLVGVVLLRCVPTLVVMSGLGGAPRAPNFRRYGDGGLRHRQPEPSTTTGPSALASSTPGFKSRRGGTGP